MPILKRPVPIGTLIAAIALSVFWIGIGSLLVEGARDRDFLNLYTGASLAGEGEFSQLFDPETQLRRERELVPATEELYPFVRPHFYAVILAPLSLIPFSAAFWVWLALHSILLIGCWTWASQRFGPDALIFGSLYLPTAVGIAHGQDCVFLLVIAIAAYAAAGKGKDLAAGALLAVGLLKFHLLLLVPVAMVLRRKWRFLQGFCAVAALEVAVSAIVAGWSGMKQYADLLLAKDIRGLSPSPELMINVHSIPKNFGIDQPLISATLVILVLGLVALGVRGAPLWRWLSVALVGSLLVPPHVYGYDASILLLPVWLALFSSKKLWARLMALALAAPPVFFLSMAGAPWSVLPALVLLLFLTALAWENHQEQRANTQQAPEEA